MLFVEAPWYLVRTAHSLARWKGAFDLPRIWVCRPQTRACLGIAFTIFSCFLRTCAASIIQWRNRWAWRFNRAMEMYIWGEWSCLSYNQCPTSILHIRTQRNSKKCSAILHAQWNAANDKNSRGLCALPLIETAFRLLNLKVQVIHLSNHALMQGGMQMVPEQQGLLELPDELQEIKNDIEELRIFSMAFIRFPPWFSYMSNLQVRVLSGSSSNQSGLNEVLRMLPPDVGWLTQLKHFTVMNFSKLIVMPQAIFNLTCLESLTIWKCPTLDLNAPEIFNVRHNCHMSFLTSLFLDNTAVSGGSFSKPRIFANLRHLSLRWHPNLIHFPFSCTSSCLQSISLQYLPLRRLPVEMSKLTGLTNLVIARCGDFEIERNISMLSSLKILTLRFLPSVNVLPNSIGTLSNLQKLKIECCSITKIPQDVCKLTNLTSILDFCLDEVGCKQTSVLHN